MHATTIAPAPPRIAEILTDAARRLGRDGTVRTVEVLDRMSDYLPWTLTELEQLCSILSLDLDELLDGARDGWEVLAS